MNPENRRTWPALACSTKQMEEYIMCGSVDCHMTLKDHSLLSMS